MTEVSAGIIKDKSGRYLICQRAEDANCGGLWEFPGGKREKGETGEQCLQRELMEELGIEANVNNIICKKEIKTPKKDLIITFFECSLISGKLCACVHQNFKWVTANGLKKYSFCPSDKEVCDNFIKPNRFSELFCKVKLVLFYIVMFTWCLPQTLAGFALFLCLKGAKRELYRGSIASYHNCDWGGVSLGAFIFVKDYQNSLLRCKVRAHEYGHCIQSLFFGPLYLPLFALPSSIWCNAKLFKNYRKKKSVPYDWFYTEKFAKWLAFKFTYEMPD